MKLVNQWAHQEVSSGVVDTCRMSRLDKSSVGLPPDSRVYCAVCICGVKDPIVVKPWQYLADCITSLVIVFRSRLPHENLKGSKPAPIQTAWTRPADARSHDCDATRADRQSSCEFTAAITLQHPSQLNLDLYISFLLCLNVFI